MLSLVAVVSIFVSQDLERVKSLIAERSYVAAAQSLTRLHRELYKKAGVVNCRPAMAAVQQLREPGATATLLRTLEESIAASDHSKACQSAFLLGMGLQAELSKLTHAERLAQQESAYSTRDTSGRPDLVGLEQLMWANYEAGQIAKAESLARELEGHASTIGPEFLPDAFRNSARTLMGLIRLNPASQSMPEALEYLRKSAEVQPTMVLLHRGPAVRLADALWQAGERDAVVAYLAQLKDFDWKPDATLVARWYEDAKAGKRPDFYRGASVPIGR